MLFLNLEGNSKKYFIITLATTPYPPPSSPFATSQTKSVYPKPLKNLNKTKLRLNKSKNNFLVIKKHFCLLKTIFLICVKI